MTREADRQAMEAVWRERASRLSRRIVVRDEAENFVPVIVVGLGEERYGIDLSDVVEVLAPVPVTPVPGVAAVFAGVINVHGEIVPVIDLRRFLGMEILPNDGTVRGVILLRSGDREIGLRTDSVEGIRWIGPGDLHVRGGNEAEPVTSRHVKGSTKDLLMLLTTEALFIELHITDLHTGVTI